MPVDAIIFDMDGTMIDSMPYHAKSWALFAQAHGVQMDIAELLRRTTGRTGVECMGELFGRPMSVAEAQPLVQHKEDIYRTLFANEFREVRGFAAFSDAARARGLKLGVGTAGDQHNIDFAFKHLSASGCNTAFDAVVGGDQGLPGKPEPAIFLEAAQRMNTSASGTIVFEDAPLGIEAARRAGMRAVAICTSHSAQELAGPHVIAAVRDYTELNNHNFWETWQ